MAEHDAKDVCLAPLAVGVDDRRAGAEVDLRLLARRRFQAPKRRDGRGAQRTHEAFHAIVGSLEAVLGDQVLPDPLGRKPLCELGQNQFAMWFAFATPAGLRGVLATRRGVRPGGRKGGIWAGRKIATPGTIRRLALGSRKPGKSGGIWPLRAGGRKGGI